MIKLSIYQRLILHISGQVYVGHETRPGWSGSLPFYVFKCPIHGLIKDYHHGFDDRLDCPLCLKETFEKRVNT